MREASKAIAIPSAVNNPKKIVGRKFESTRIEKPTIMVIAV